MRVALFRITSALLFLSVLLLPSKTFAQTAAPQDSGGGAGASAPAGSGNYGPLRRIGGGVSAPAVLFHVAPQFSEEARQKKFMGVVLINMIVDQQGRPQNVHVLRGVGMGLDEKAIKAVKQYKFKPALLGGKPVPVELNVEINFQMF